MVHRVEFEEADQMLALLNLCNDDEKEFDNFIPHAGRLEGTRIDNKDYRVISLEDVDFEADFKQWPRID